jgi:hypothetical protein
VKNVADQLAEGRGAELGSAKTVMGRHFSLKKHIYKNLSLSATCKNYESFGIAFASI